MNFKDTKKSINCTTEKNSLLVGSFNYIEAIKIPLGVKVYLTFDSDLDFTKAHILTDTFEVFKNKDVYADVEKLGTQIYLHTEGTSDIELELYCAVIGGNGFFIKNTPLATIDLENDVKQSLAEQNIKSFDVTLLQELDKVINPFNVPTIINEDYNSIAVTTTVFNKTLQCDKIKLNIGMYWASNTDGYTRVYLDNKVILALDMKTTVEGYDRNAFIEVENVRGKQLFISTVCPNYYTYYTLQEFTKKS